MFSILAIKKERGKNIYPSICLSSVVTKVIRIHKLWISRQVTFDTCYVLVSRRIRVSSLHAPDRNEEFFCFNGFQPAHLKCGMLEGEDCAQKAIGSPRICSESYFFPFVTEDPPHFSSCLGFLFIWLPFLILFHSDHLYCVTNLETLQNT